MRVPRLEKAQSVLSHISYKLNLLSVMLAEKMSESTYHVYLYFHKYSFKHSDIFVEWLLGSRILS